MQFQTNSQNVTLGAVALVIDIIVALVITTIVKLVSEDVSVIVILLFRYLFCLPILVGFGLFMRGPAVFRVVNRRAQALRTVFGMFALSAWMLAISRIEITTATAVFQTLPVFITVFAPFLLGERIGLRRFSAVLIGLVGTLIILRPDQEGWLQLGTVAAIASPFFAALMCVYLRKLGQSDAPVTTAVFYNAAGTAVFLILCLALPVNWPAAPLDFVLLIGCGLLSSIQQFLMALSHKLAPASTLAPLHYTAVPMAIVIGIVVFDETISMSFLLGTAVIVSSTYYIFVRERRVRGAPRHRPGKPRQ